MISNDAACPPQSFSKFRWLAILLAILCTVAVGLAWDRFVKAYPSYAVGDFLGFWGLIAGLLGVTVSIIGFGFGLAQLRRTQTASTAAARAAQKIRKSYDTFEILQLLSHTKGLAKQAVDHLNGNRYVEMAVCYRDLQANLWRIGSTEGVFSARHGDDLKDLAGDAREAYSVLTAKSSGARCGVRCRSS